MTDRASGAIDADDPVLWRRLDLPGHETARLVDDEGGGRRLTGTAVFAHERRACRLDYVVVCDASWRTRSARVEGFVGNREIDLDVSVTPGGRWLVNGDDCSAVAGCVDIDLGFSPSTNLLPIRRLSLEPGAEASVTAAWLPFPALVFEPLEQVYRREGASTYWYASAGGAFVRTLEVDPTGFVVNYPGLWCREFPAGAPPEATAHVVEDAEKS